MLMRRTPNVAVHRVATCYALARVSPRVDVDVTCSGDVESLSPPARNRDIRAASGRSENSWPARLRPGRAIERFTRDRCDLVEP